MRSSTKLNYALIMRFHTLRMKAVMAYFTHKSTARKHLKKEQNKLKREFGNAAIYEIEQLKR